MSKPTDEDLRRRNICILQENYEWLNSQRKTIKGPYTPGKKESFDTVIGRIREMLDPKEKKD